MIGDLQTGDESLRRGALDTTRLRKQDSHAAQGESCSWRQLQADTSRYLFAGERVSEASSVATSWTPRQPGARSDPVAMGWPAAFSIFRRRWPNRRMREGLG